MKKEIVISAVLVILSLMLCIAGQARSTDLLEPGNLRVQTQEVTND